MLTPQFDPFSLIFWTFLKDYDLIIARNVSVFSDAKKHNEG